MLSLCLVCQKYVRIHDNPNTDCDSLTIIFLIFCLAQLTICLYMVDRLCANLEWYVEYQSILVSSYALVLDYFLQFHCNHQHKLCQLLLMLIE